MTRDLLALAVTLAIADCKCTYHAISGRDGENHTRLDDLPRSTWLVLSATRLAGKQTTRKSQTIGSHLLLLLLGMVGAEKYEAVMSLMQVTSTACRGESRQRHWRPPHDGGRVASEHTVCPG